MKILDGFVSILVETFSVGYSSIKRVKDLKGKIVERNEALRFNIVEEMTNREILDRILFELTRLPRNLKNKQWYIDTNRLETVGKFKNWKMLFAELYD